LIFTFLYSVFGQAGGTHHGADSAIGATALWHPTPAPHEHLARV